MINQYVPIQENKSDKPYVHYLMVYSGNGDSIIYKSAVDPTLSYEEMVHEVDGLLQSFPKFICNNVYEKTDLYNEVARNVAIRSIRGRANTFYKNSFYYKGTSIYDSPIIVVKSDKKYAVFTHPDFKNYGYVLNFEN